jgi:hypothetical protein
MNPIPAQTPRRELFTYGEVASDMRISLRTFNELVAAGKVRVVSVSPGLKRIPAAERERLLSEGIRR